MNKDEHRMSYGYDDLHHEKYYCAVDYFIDACPIEYIRIYDYALLELSRRLLKKLDVKI